MELMGVVALLVAASSIGAAWGEEEREWGLVYRRCDGGAVNKGKATEAVLERSVMAMVDAGGVRNDLHVVYNNNNNRRGGMLWEAEVEMRGECEASLDTCECLQCFAHAILHCPPSLSAYIRLHSCSISYAFPPAPGVNGGGGAKRIAAIVVGASVAVCLALLFVLFLRSRYLKRDYYY